MPIEPGAVFESDDELIRELISQGPRKCLKDAEGVVLITKAGVCGFKSSRYKRRPDFSCETASDDEDAVVTSDLE